LIVFILPDLSGGGAQRVFVNLITGLYQQGISVEVIVFNEDGALASSIPKGVDIHNLQTKTLRRSLFPLISKLRSLKPSVVFSTFGYINVGLLLFRLLIPKDIKIWIREANLPSVSLPNNPYPSIISLGYRMLYRIADKIICSSERMADEFINDFNLPASKLHLLPNPVNEKMIQSMIVNVTDYQNDRVNFIAMGRLTYQKGFDRLLQWFSNLESKKSVLRIIGSGPMEAELKDLVIQLNLSERVVFVRYIDNPWEKIAASDVFLLPSRWEGMSNAALESLACGTPVIATAESGGILELSKCAKHGVVVVTSTEIEFCIEMEKIKSGNSKQLKDSLLPARYSLENVLEVFNAQL